MHTTRLGAVALAALLSASAVQAEGLSAKIWNENNRGQVEVKGSAAQFPDGTELRVEVLVKGNFARPIVGAFFRVRVTGGQFVQKHARPAIFPPLGYTVKLKLHVNNQAPPVRKILEQKFGWPRTHIEDLDFSDVTLGTAEESARFRLDTLRRLRGLSEELFHLVGDLKPATKQAKADNPQWDATKTEFAKAARVLGGKVRRFGREYAVLPDKDLLDNLSKSLNKLSAIVQHIDRDGAVKDAKRDIGYVNDWVLALHSDVNGRLPVEERTDAPKPRKKQKQDDERADEEPLEEPSFQAPAEEQDFQAPDESGEINFQAPDEEQDPEPKPEKGDEPKEGDEPEEGDGPQVEEPESKPTSQPAEPEAEPEPKADISHVKAGQEYVFEAKAAGNTTTIIYRVEKVEDGVVTYGLSTVIEIAGEKKEMPGPSMKWPTKATPAPDQDAPKVETKELPNETVKVGNLSFDCKVTETSFQGTTSKVWSPEKPKGVMTFPPMIRAETKGPIDTTMVLVEIRE